MKKEMYSVCSEAFSFACIILLYIFSISLILITFVFCTNFDLQVVKHLRTLSFNSSLFLMFWRWQKKFSSWFWLVFLQVKLPLLIFLCLFENKRFLLGLWSNSNDESDCISKYYIYEYRWIGKWLLTLFARHEDENELNINN